MVNSKVFIIIVLFTGMILSSCSVAPVTKLFQSTVSAETSKTAYLAAGTLLLESSSLSVTEAQAADLLPLWKAVKSLTNDNYTSAEEISALYAQIDETMTAEQVKAIQGMDFNQETLTSLMTQYGVQELAQAGAGIMGNDSASIYASGGDTAGSTAVSTTGLNGTTTGSGTSVEALIMSAQNTASQARTETEVSTVSSNESGTNLAFVDTLIEILKEKAQIA